MEAHEHAHEEPMTQADLIERRQHRRAELRAQIVIRGLDGKHANDPGVIGRVKNVSLSGAYAYVPATFTLPAGSTITFSVSIPQESNRAFPFVRLLGKGWIVRVDRPDHSAKRKAAQAKEAAAASREGSTLTLQEILGSGEELGLAIAFTRDVTALGSVGAGYQ